MNISELMETGKYEDAIQILKVALIEKPNDQARRTLVNCYIRADRYEEALVELKALTEMTNDDLRMLAGTQYRLSLWNEMGATLRRLSQAGPSAGVFHGLAVAELGGRPVYQLDAASRQVVKEHLLLAAKYEDCRPEMFSLLLSVSYSQNTTDDDLQRILEEAHARFSDDPDFRLQLADFLARRQQNPQHVLELVAPLLDNSEYSDQAHWCAFLACVAMGQWEKAVLHLDALKLDPSDETNRQRIKTDLSLRKGKPGEWLVACEALHTSASGNTEMSELRRAYVNLTLGDSKSAIALFVRAMSSLVEQDGLPLDRNVFIMLSPSHYPIEYTEFDVLLGVCEALRRLGPEVLSSEVKGYVAYILYASDGGLEREHWNDIFPGPDTLLATAAKLLNYPMALKRALALESAERDLPLAMGMLIDHAIWQGYIDEDDLEIFRDLLLGDDNQIPQDRRNEADQIAQMLTAKFREHQESQNVSDIFKTAYVHVWRDILFGLAQYELVLELNRQSRIVRGGDDGLFDLAYSLAKLGRSDEAEAAYKELVEKRPQNAAALNNLGVIYERKGMLDKAAKLFSDAAEIDPEDELFRKNRDGITARLEKWKAAQHQIASLLENAREHVKKGGFSDLEIDAINNDYWETNKSNADIQFDHHVRPSGPYGLKKLILPRPAGVACPNCSSEMFFRNRSDRTTKSAECLGCGHRGSSYLCKCEYCSHRRQEEQRNQAERQKQQETEKKAAERKRAIEELARLEAKYWNEGHVAWALGHLTRKEQLFLKALADNLQIDGHPDFAIICENAGVVSEKAYLKKLHDLKLVFEDPEGKLILNRALDIASIQLETVRQIKPALRFEVLQRDNHTCQYCGRTPPEVKLVIDHLVPVSKGGTDEFDNLVTSCEDCNSGKSDKLIQTFTGGLTKEGRVDQIRALRSSLLQARRERLEEIRAKWKGALGKQHLSEADEETVLWLIERYDPDWIIAAIGITGKKQGLKDHAIYAKAILRKWAKDGPPENLYNPDAGLEKHPATAKQITYIASLLKQAGLELKDVSDKPDFDSLTMLDAKIIINGLTAPSRNEG